MESRDRIGGAGGLSEAKRALLLRRLRARGGNSPATDAITPRADRRTAPLSYIQAQMWFMDQFDPGNPVYNRPVALRIRGALDADALERALAQIVARHEILRTRFVDDDGVPWQRVEASAAIPIDHIDLDALPQAEREAQAARRVVEAARAPFDLARGPLVRAHLLRMAPDDHILLICLHHIVFDGWSETVLRRELLALYRAARAGVAADLPPPAIQYGDYAIWQRARVEGPASESLRAYWRRQLEGVRPLELPTDRPRPALLTHVGARVSRDLPAELTQAVHACARDADATLFMVMVAAFFALVHRYGGQDDIALGTAVAGRRRLELEGLIGPFINTLVLRARVDAQESFAALLARARAVALDAFAHQDMPFEQLIEDLVRTRDPSRTPLIQAFVQVRNMPRDATTGGELRMESLPVDLHAAKLDLALDITEGPDGLHCEFEFNTDLFDTATIRALAEHYERLLADAVASAHTPLRELASWDSIGAARVPRARGGGERPVVSTRGESAPYAGFATFVDLFEAQVAATPDATAVVGTGDSVSYAQLDMRANAIARRLCAAGVRAGAPVALLAERATDTIAAMLGILKAGGAYVPLDPAYPESRLRWMLADCGAGIVVTQRRLLDRLALRGTNVVLLDGPTAATTAESGTALARPRCDDAAYIMYTSGSTGTPKGVVVTHGALLSYVDAAQRLYRLTPADRVLQFAPLSFDGSVEEIYCALAAGATLVLRDDSMLARTDAFLHRCAERGITLVSLTAAYWHLLTTAIEADQLPIPDCLRLLTVGGEKMNAESVRKWLRCVRTPVRLLNTYGPTETTVIATAYEIPQVDPAQLPADIPIGRPLANARAYVLDAAREPVAVGAVGELWIGGAGVARGYLNRAELTAERFVPDPFSGGTGDRMYRTGDLCRWRADGELEYLGRADDQVKVRGYRIEPGEVESVLLRHARVRAAAVVAREERLVAYVVFGDAGAVSAGELRAHAEQELPAYMVPSVFVALAALPLTPGGKVDRRALLAAQGERLEREEAYVAPRTPVEEVLAGIWAQVLGVERVGARDNFFELGGHSMLATQVMSRVRVVLGAEVALRELFDHPTLEGFVARVESAKANTASESRAGDETFANTEAVFPASFAQQRLWFLEQLDPGQTVYVIPKRMRILGDLDASILERALNAVVERHESLRTTIRTQDGEPVQVVAAHLAVPLEVVDLRHEDPQRRAQRAGALAQEIAGQPFDLARGPLLRARLIRLDEREHLLAIPTHHVISDGWSMSILQRELALLYDALRTGAPSPLPELPVQYADFSAWQREQLQGETLQGQVEFWRRQLQGSTPLDLPVDRPRAVRAGQRGAREQLTVAAALAGRLRALASQENTTLFMIMLAAFQLLLQRHCGQDDVAVGVPVAGRVHPDIEGLIGFFINSLVLRTDLAGDPDFRTLLARVKESALGAYSNQDLPFERLVEELRPPRDPVRHPFFEVMINYLADAGAPLEHGGLRFLIDDMESDTAKFPLTLYIREREDGSLFVQMAYQLDLFDRQHVVCLLDQVHALLAQIADAPQRRIGEYTLTTPGARAVLPDPQLALDEPAYEPVTVLFRRHAAQTPDAVAVVQGARQWTYAELDARACALASALRASGLQSGERVAVAGGRSFGLIVGLLGVLLAGGVMIPLDGTLPWERRRLMLQTAQARRVVWAGTDADAGWHAYRDFGAEIHQVAPDTGFPPTDGTPRAGAELPVPAPRDPAYVFYTSGSTGVPKGVLGTHQGVSHFVHWQRETFAIGPGDRVSQLTSPSFDVLLRDVFLPLTSGATLCLPEEADLYDVPAWIERRGLTVLHTVPALMQTWLANRTPGIALGTLRWVFVAGEPLTDTLVRKWRAAYPDAGRMVNLYGATETTLVKCFYEVPDDPLPGVQPAGSPLPHAQVLVLGPGDRPCGIGEPGEIVVRTPFATLGYLNPEGQDRRAFAPNPFRADSDERVYYTGDRGRWRPDGLLEIRGRLDDQVKIRGVRVEPAEVAAVLSRHEQVRECAVIALAEASAPDERFLAAYVVSASAAQRSEESLRAFLGARLPAVMIPAAIVFLDALPKTTSGKIDRKALPRPQARASARRADAVAPRTDLERMLAAIWCEVLKLDEVSVHDDFFALGGHSLTVTQVVARVRKRSGADVSLRALFEAPTIAGFAARIEAARAAATAGTGIRRVPRVPGRAPRATSDPDAGAPS